jgi:hypothetical protein
MAPLPEGALEKFNVEMKTVGMQSFGFVTRV